MNELPFLQNYSGEKLESLLSREGQYRTDSLMLALEEALDRKRKRKGVESLSDQEIIVFSICALEREVNNGGYNQFFLNPSNVYTDRIVGDLKEVGCISIARITESAIQALGVSELTAAVIEARVFDNDEALSAAHEACDAEYYKTDDSIESKLCEFVKRNQDAFSIPLPVRIGAWFASVLRR